MTDSHLTFSTEVIVPCFTAFHLLTVLIKSPVSPIWVLCLLVFSYMKLFILFLWHLSYTSAKNETTRLQYSFGVGMGFSKQKHYKSSFIFSQQQLLLLLHILVINHSIIGIFHILSFWLPSRFIIETSSIEDSGFDVHLSDWRVCLFPKA